MSPTPPAWSKGWVGLGGKPQQGEEPSRLASDGGDAGVQVVAGNAGSDLHAAEEGSKGVGEGHRRDARRGGRRRRAVEPVGYFLSLAEKKCPPPHTHTGRAHAGALPHRAAAALLGSCDAAGVNFDLEEEAWTLGPHGEITLVDMRLPMLPKFRLNMRTVNLLAPVVEDAHRLGDSVLQRREVVDMQTEGDGLVAYKLVEVVFPYLGLQQRAEALIKESQMNIFRKVDKIIRDNEATWQGMSDEEVDAVLSESYERLKGPAALAREASLRDATPCAQAHEVDDQAEDEVRNVPGDSPPAGAAVAGEEEAQEGGAGREEKTRRRGALTHEQTLQAYYDFAGGSWEGHGGGGASPGTCRK